MLNGAPRIAAVKRYYDELVAILPHKSEVGCASLLPVKLKVTNVSSSDPALRAIRKTSERRKLRRELRKRRRSTAKLENDRKL